MTMSDSQLLREAAERGQMSDKTTLPELGEAVLRRPALVKQGDEYDDNPAALFAFTAHGFDTDLTPFYSAAQLKAGMEAAWLASRKQAMEEAARIAERTYAKDAFHFALGSAAASAIRAGAGEGGD